MKLENPETPITVGSSNVDLDEAMREHARESIRREAAKYFGRLTQAGVHFTREGSSYRCSVNIQMGGLNMVSAESVNKDVRHAFDVALNKAAKQLRRTKTELRD